MKKTEKSNTNEIIEIPAEEAPYALPDGWKWVRFGSVCTFENGYAFKSENFSLDLGLPVIRISNIKDDEIDVDSCVLTTEENIDSRFIVNNGDLLIAMSGATTGKNGDYLSHRIAYLNQRVGNIKIKNSEILCDKFRNYYIKEKSEEILRLAYGGAQPNISSNKICQMLIPLPPLETQKRIVERIESLFAKLDEAKEKAQTALDTFELRKSTILHKAFTGELTAKWREENRNVAVTSEHSDNLTSAPAERLNGVTSYSEDSNNVTPSSVEYPNNLISVPSSPSNNPNQSDTDSVEQDADKCKESFFIGSEYYQNLVSSNLRLKKSYSMVNSWTYSTLENVCKTIKYGTSKKSEKTGKVVVLRMGNMKNGGLDWSDLAYTNDEEDIKKYWLIPGDVLFNRTNSSEWVGKVSIYRGEMPSIYAGYIIKLDYDRNILNGEYFNYILNSPEEREYCQAVKTDGVNQANINSKKIGAFVIPVPPLSEQQEIVRILDDLLAKENAAKEAAEAVIEKIDLMKKSILARAFRGEL